MPDSIKMLIIRLFVIAGAFLYFVLGFDLRYGALLFAWIGMTFFILRAYDDWGTFLKRCLLSLPIIATVELVLFGLIRPERYTYWCTTAILFDALILKVPKVLYHYITTLSIAAISMFLIYKKSIAGIAFYTYSEIFLAFFCGSYLIIINRNKDKYSLVFVKSFITGLLIALFVWVFIASDKIIKLYKIPFGYAYGFSCFLGLIFMVAFFVLAKDYLQGNTLFKKGKILEPFEDYLNDLKESVGITQKRNK